jgi:hypothetical protein
MLTVGTDPAACLWDLPTKKIIDKRKGALAASMPLDASSIAVTGAGTRVYSAKANDHDSTTFPGTWAQARGINDKGWLTVITGHALRFLDPKTLENAHEMVPSTAVYTSVSSDCNWRSVQLASGEAEIRITGTDELLCHISVWNYGSNPSMDVSSKRLAAIDVTSRFVVCFDRSGKELWRYDSKAAAPGCCIWSPDARHLPSVCRTGK